MRRRPSPALASRKQPRQARSAQLVDDILEAAVRVLRREGARSFTTVRVAAEAGVSVGSLYQYFPNKEALLFRLQSDEWKDTGALLDEILSDARRKPLDRLRHAVRIFFRSELEEAELRVGLDDAGALFRHAPEARDHMSVVTARMLAFVEAALPAVPAKKRAFAADVLLTSMAAIGEKITEQRRTRAEVDAYAEVVADMLCGFLEDVGREAKPRSGARGRLGP